MTTPARVLRASVLAMTASAAACAPSTFDNLTGGALDAPADDPIGAPHGGDARVDPSLPAPRPVSPLSVTWVNTAKPRFRWELARGTTGAVVELSRTRDFGAEVQRFIATGGELVLPEAVEPGIWFWRLKGRGIDSEGVLSSPVWEVLVRGPGLAGASDSPNGGILDLDGNGEPDLNVVIMAVGEKPEDPLVPVLFTLLGQPGGKYNLFDERSAIGGALLHPDPALGGAIDVDGDGYSDTPFAEIFTNPEDLSEKDGAVFVVHGGPTGMSTDKDRAHGYLDTPLFEELPHLDAAGDVNGDGYGDIGASFLDLGFAMLGGPKGARTMMVFAQQDRALGAAALAGGCDLDGDGLSDVVVASSDTSSPIRYARGTVDRFTALASPTFGGVMSVPSRASALTSGDFDGDGTTDVAFTTLVDGKPAICAYSVESESMTMRSCWGPDAWWGDAEPAPDDATRDGFGLSLAAGDLDGDGKDEILVASASGIVALTHHGVGFTAEGTSFEAAAIPGSFAPRVAMIHPGRPTKAKWAVYGADAKSIHVFTGTETTQKIDLSKDQYFLAVGASIR